MVFAEIIIQKTERNKNQSKQNEQGKTIIQKTYKTEKKKEKKKKRTRTRKKNHSMDQPVFKSIRSRTKLNTSKQTNKKSQEQQP